MDPSATHNFKSTFDRLDAGSIDLVDSIYTPDIHFIDPIHEYRGLEPLRKYYTRLYEGVDQCRFEWHFEVGSGQEVVLTWTMVMTHKHFRPGREVRMPGASHLRFRDGKACYHHDYFDMGVMIYERVPLLGALIRRIKGRL